MTQEEYFRHCIYEDLEAAFERGEANYTGKLSWEDHHCTTRTAAEDVHHVRECHIEVRVREAEEFADCGDLAAAQKKLVSAIGYLSVLHRRLQMKKKEQA